MTTSFAGFSAWFAPELHSYRSTWFKFGGEEKELAEADIAFVTDKTSSGEASHKPTLKILRPDWIEDSVHGRKRLSLKRYKTVFPALTRFDSGEYSNMAVGMDAFNSTKVISLESPWQFHQPEPEPQDLSVTPSSRGASHKPSMTQGSVVERRTSSPFNQSHSSTATPTSKRRSTIATPGSAPRSVTITTESMRTFAVSQSDSEKADDEENDDDDSEYKEDDELANVDYQEDESTVARPEIFGRLSRLGRKTMPKEPLSDNSMEGFEALEESGSPVTRSYMPEATAHIAATKKRRLPRSLQRSKREAARTHNSQVSEEFFASSDDETYVAESRELKRSASSQRSVDKADTVPLSSRGCISSATFHSLEGNQLSTQGHDVSQHKTRYMRAEDYLRNTLARLDKGPKQLLLAKPPGVRLIDIRRENIDLRKKRQ